MSGHTAEEIKAEVRRYWLVGFALFLLTIITVAVSYMDVSPAAAIAIALAIACLKGGMVAGVFMHLISERQAIYGLLVLTAIFFLFLMLGPVSGRLGGIAIG